MQLEILAVIPWIVVHGLKDGAIGAHKPFRRAQGVLGTDVSPLFVAGPVTRPPEQLQVHHGVDDRVVAIYIPRCDQLRLRIEQLFQPLRSARRARTERLIVRQIRSKRRRVVVQKTGVVILLRFLANKLRTPQFRPFSVLLFVSCAVQFPKLSDPEAPRPEVSLLLLPFSGLVVGLGEKSLPRT